MDTSALWWWASNFHHVINTAWIIFARHMGGRWDNNNQPTFWRNRLPASSLLQKIAENGAGRLRSGPAQTVGAAAIRVIISRRTVRVRIVVRNRREYWQMRRRYRSHQQMLLLLLLGFVGTTSWRERDCATEFCQLCRRRGRIDNGRRERIEDGSRAMIRLLFLLLFVDHSLGGKTRSCRCRLRRRLALEEIDEQFGEWLVSQANKRRDIKWIFMENIWIIQHEIIHSCLYENIEQQFGVETRLLSMKFNIVFVCLDFLRPISQVRLLVTTR